MELSHTLYTLMLSTVSFIVVFALCIGFFPSLTPLTTQLNSINGTSAIQAGNLNGLNQYANFTTVTLTPDILFPYASGTTVTLSDQTIIFHWIDEDGKGDMSMFLAVQHKTSAWWGFVDTTHYLVEKSGHIDYFYPLYPLTEVYSQGLSANWLLANEVFENSSDISMYCQHITINMHITANDTSHTLTYAIENHHAIDIAIGYSLDFSAMGTDVWGIIAGMFTFSTFQTGEATVDWLFNGIIGLTCWLSLLYIGYRLITGIIPTLSGGGGQ